MDAVESADTSSTLESMALQDIQIDSTDDERQTPGLSLIANGDSGANSISDVASTAQVSPSQTRTETLHARPSIFPVVANLVCV